MMNANMNKMAMKRGSRKKKEEEKYKGTGEINNKKMSDWISSPPGGLTFKVEKIGQ